MVGVAWVWIASLDGVSCKSEWRHGRDEVVGVAWVW